MGKDLHYSIQPFIEKAITKHSHVTSLTLIEDAEFYVYNASRKNGLTNVVIVLSDAYDFDHRHMYNKPNKLKDGGFYLIALPEASEFYSSLPEQRIIAGKLKILMGALTREDFYNYEPPKEDE